MEKNIEPRNKSSNIYENYLYKGAIVQLGHRGYFYIQKKKLGRNKMGYYFIHIYSQMKWIKVLAVNLYYHEILKKNRQKYLLKALVKPLTMKDSKTEEKKQMQLLQTKKQQTATKIKSLFIKGKKTTYKHKDNHLYYICVI